MEITGDVVFKALMDVDLILKDGAQMVALKFLLGGVENNHPALCKLYEEVTEFHTLIARLCAAAKEQSRGNNSAS